MRGVHSTSKAEKPGGIEPDAGKPHAEKTSSTEPVWRYRGYELRPGGRFSYRMEARDGSMGFGFAGTFVRVVPNEVIEYSLSDERPVIVEFLARDHGVTVRETFEAESSHAADQQRQGWEAIPDRFAEHVEAGD